MEKRNIFIGVAWPYVNGTLHIGHMAGYLLPADICSRYHRLIGNNVLMVSGSDCFGTPTTVEADKRGVTPKEIAEEYHAQNVDIFLNTAKFTYDLYTKTDNPQHIKETQEIFLKMLNDGYIYIDTTEQYYSPEENRFLPDRYVVGTCPFCGYEDCRSDQCDECGKLITHGELINPLSNLSKRPVELRETDHYFLDWSKLQEFLEEYVSKHNSEWKEWVKKETQGWLTEGLEARAITRDLDWGVPIPTDRISQDKRLKNAESKRIYVWFDAVIGYLSASKKWADDNEMGWQRYWYKDEYNEPIKHYYFMGKDNLVFHCLFWPGQLHVYDSELHLPDLVSINNFLNLDGRQFSKSRGIVINIEDFINDYGNDAARFYLTHIMPENKDSSFVWSDFEQKVNGVLVATLGNFIHRVLSIGKKEDVKIFNARTLSPDVASVIEKSFKKTHETLEVCKFREYLDTFMELAQFGNKLVDSVELWTLKEKDPEKFNQTLFDLYGVIVALSYLMAPLLFDASEKIQEMFCIINTEWPGQGQEVAEIENCLHSLQTMPKNPKPLFSKIELTK